MPRLLLLVIVSLGIAAPRLRAQAVDPLAAVDRTMAAAEASLREGEIQRAESLYRAALFDAWMMVGGLDVAAGRLTEAKAAFVDASRAVVDARAALQSLALVHLQSGDAAEAVTVLARLGGRHTDPDTDRLLAQAMMANGQLPEAVQTLEAAHAGAPEDAEIAFLLGSAYLRAKKPDAAAPLFAQVLAARPGADSHVLIGRTYRDFGHYDLARTALQRALKTDPKARRAHYYLGTLAVLQDGILRLDEAIREFRAELKLAPRDEVTNLRLGIALEEAQRHSEALPHLEIAATATGSAEAFYYLGRCQLGLDRPADAVTALRQALDRATKPPVVEGRVQRVHYQLALALRGVGKTGEAAKHFDESRQASARRAGADREVLAGVAGDPADSGAASAGVVPIESPFASMPPADREALSRRIKVPIARAYLNLGVMHAQGQRFARAAELFEQSARVDPAFPGIQYSLGVAYFNAQRFEQATEPLARALAADGANADLRRMLAVAWFNAGSYAKAADLLAGDPTLESNLSLQYTYGLALVRSDRAAEAESIFSKLIAQYVDNAELQVVMGQAHAQQGDFEEAIAALERALTLKPGVPEANTTLGTIYLRQGKLAAATAALKAELSANPADTSAQYLLATVLDLDGHPEAAVAVLRDVLRAKPSYADARYLLGKVLLAQGHAANALEQLQIAVRLAPDDPNVQYQLGQAYQKMGRADLAEQAFARFRALKDKRRGGTP